MPSKASLKSACEHPWLGLFCGLKMEVALPWPGQSSALLPVAAFQSLISSPFRVNIFEKREVRTVALALLVAGLGEITKRRS